ncbi:MAG TPA: sulfatase [Vicinamibacterales bacterium]|jgi:arylsulfatase A-like enzyme|nr:sulfatase [Vicinamibacterales bacterium]
MRIRLVVIPAAALVVVCSGLASARLQPRPSNLVVITLDTTRADRLPAYGFSGVRTPALDRVVREGVVFDRANTVAPLTLPSHVSLFTGRYPPRHHVRDNADVPLAPGTPTLAEMLHASGFRTAAFVASVVLSAQRGLARGFQTYVDGSRGDQRAPRRRDGRIVVDEASAWIDQHGGAPFFVWVHLYDVHGPQSLPLELRRAYGDSYEGGIAYADAQVGRLIDTLERHDLLGSTAIIVAGDHGESLGDHGEREHGVFIYESTIHVPLIVRSPGIRPGRSTDLVSLVDVAPTVLDLLRIPRAAQFDGVSLVAALGGRRLPEREIYAESMYPAHFGWSPIRMLRDARMKFIEAPRPELYDLAVDPFEQRDLSSDRPRLVDAMRARLAMFAEASSRDQAMLAPSAETVRELAALGYASGGPARTVAPQLDAKDYIQALSLRQHPSFDR